MRDRGQLRLVRLASRRRLSQPRTRTGAGSVKSSFWPSRLRLAREIGLARRAHCSMGESAITPNERSNQMAPDAGDRVEPHRTSRPTNLFSWSGANHEPIGISRHTKGRRPRRRRGLIRPGASSRTRTSDWNRSIVRNGAPGGTQTPNHLVRRQVLGELSTPSYHFVYYP